MQKAFEQFKGAYPLICYSLLGYFLWFSRGAYHTSHLIIFCLSFVLLLILGLRESIAQLSDKSLARWLALIMIFQTQLLWKDLRIVHAHQSTDLIHGLVGFVLAVSVVFLIQQWRGNITQERLLVVLAVLALIAARIATLIVSPDPRIDVFTVQDLAPDYLLNGQSPYGSFYPKTHAMQYDYPLGFTYWPSVLVWISPAKWIFGDFRYAQLFAQVLTGFLFFAIAKRTGYSNRIASLVLLVWLSNPVSLFVLEQAWSDSLLVAAVILIFYLLVSQRLAWAAIVTGHMVAMKQYDFFIPLLILPSVILSDGWVRAVRFTGISLVSFAVFCIPLAVWNWDGFYHDTIGVILNTSLRTDSFAIPALLKNLWNIEIPFIFSIVLYLVCLAGLFTWVYKGPKNLNRAAFAITALFGILFLFGKQAFCNYYYLLSSFMLVSEVLNGRRKTA